MINNNFTKILLIISLGLFITGSIQHTQAILGNNGKRQHLNQEREINIEFNQTYGGTVYEWVYEVIQTSDGGFALGGTTQSFGTGGWDMWLVKTDGDGTITWNQTYGGTLTDSAKGLVQTSDGGYAIAGQTSSYGAGGGDIWLVKTDGDGTITWNQTYGGTGADNGGSLIQTSDGGYAIA
ncbi:MAG: hypothetical protein ACW99Q_16195, partial [Candidatus Kariarchaeaceae archaeon]